MRRAASGRLSEIAGPATLAYDRTMRTLGLRRRAVEDYPALPAGNACRAGGLCPRGQRLDRGARPVQRGGVPDPRHTGTLGAGGQPAVGRDDGAVAVAQLAHRAVPAVAVGPGAATDDRWAVAAGRWRRTAGGRHRTIPPAMPTSAGGLLAALPRFPDPYTLPGTASNEWAVDGRHTATGAPLLAGDPHLAFGFPAIWYLARIETPEGVLVGATAPGVPCLVLGHNGHIAWTFTTTGADVQDVFIETPAGDGQYQTPDGPASLHRARGAHQGPRRAGPDADGARDPAWAGGQRPARRGRPDTGRRHGQSRPGQHRRRRSARAEPGAGCRGRRQGRRPDHLAGAEPAGRRSPAHRALRHRPGADQACRRRIGSGAGRRLA